MRATAQPSSLGPRRLRRDAILLGAALSLAMGLRPSAALFLGPLALWATWRHRDALAATVASAAATTAAWFLPAVAAGGGLRDFVAYNRFQSDRIILSRPAWQDPAAVGHHASQAWDFAPREWAFALAALLLLAVAALAVRPAWSQRSRFLVAWAAPPALFYVVVYSGWPVYPSGYALAVLPAVAAASALAVLAVARAVRSSGAALPAQVLALAVVGAVALVPATWAAAWDDALAEQRDADAFDRDWDRAIAAGAFPANETAFLTLIHWHWARLEHPDHLTWGVRPYWSADGTLLLQVTQARSGHVDRPMLADFADGPIEAPHPVPNWVKQVVLLDAGGEALLLKPGVALREGTLPSGRTVLAFDPAGLDNIEQALRWFDINGTLDLAALDPEDRRAR